jgi:hypothetical protein
MTRWLMSSPLFLALATCANGVAPSPPDGATVTIRADGMTPKEISINRGQRVTFVNLDSQAHRPMSDPHPEHSSCAVLNLASIPAGSRLESAIISDALDCRLHDETKPGDAAFTTRILIGLQ